MKTITRVLIILLLICNADISKAQFVTIPDSNFVNWLNANGYSQCLIGDQLDTTCNAVVSTNSMFINHANIHDLTGISYFDNLYWLEVKANYLSTLPPLPYYLGGLMLDSNLFNNLPSIPPHLISLYCPNNNLTYIDSLPQTLYILSCGDNKIDSLNLNNGLGTLLCFNNKLDSLPVLPVALKVLNCNYNYLTELPTLPAGLISLDCSNNQIANLPVLPGMLENLRASHNLLSTLPILPPTLLELEITDNDISSLPDPLPPSLEDLRCQVNLISSLPSLPSTLKVLFAGQNQITQLPTLPAGLTLLGCDDNQISVLPSLPNTIYQLFCQINQLTSLPPLPAALLQFHCDNNQLTSLPAIPVNARDIGCSNNQISVLPAVPDSMHLLKIDNNPISCLPAFHNVGVFVWNNTNINCLPNPITITTVAFPLVSGFPICNIFNTESCNFYWNISGTVNNSVAATCNPNTIKPPARNVKINLYQNGNLVQQTISDDLGRYTLDTDTGTYIYTADTSQYYTVVCPSSGIRTATISAIDSIDYHMDFSIHCTNGFDVGVASVVRDHGAFRPAEYADVKVACGDFSNQYGLNCAAGVSGEVRIRIDGPAAFINSVAGALIPVVSGDTLIYTIADYGAIDFYNDFAFTLQTDTTAVNIQSICFDISATPISGDNDTVNNHFEQCFPVVNSYDPNEKEVFPSIIGNAEGGWITYTIRFQNTGNAPAQHIYIIDTLDAGVMEETFQLLSYSQQPMVQINGKVVRFNFQGIYLADSVNNEPDSHGYVQFKVKSRSDLAESTPIENNAFIYFDFNSPVETNTVSTNVNCATTVNISATICEGGPYYFGGNNLTTSGIYTMTQHFTNLCDTITTLDLTVMPTHFTIAQVICLGDSFMLNGNAITSAGIYAATLLQSNGCDSIITLDLSVTSIDSSITASICNGDAFNFNGMNLSSPGNYTDTIHVDGYCDTIVSLDLSVTSQMISVIHTGNLLSTPDPGNYQWLDCNTNTAIPGATGNQFNPSANGSFGVVVSNGDCADTSACITFVISGVETIDANTISINPNPVKDILYIQSSEPIKELTIYNSIGEIIFYQGDIPSGTFRLNTLNFAKGLYFIDTIRKADISRKRFIKE